MLFDIRGRRKNVVRVVYAVLAVLMGASLFLVVGGLNIAELFSSNGSGDAAKPYEEQSERIEVKLRKDPENPDLLVSLTRAQVNTANAKVTVEENGQRAFTPEAVQEYQQANQTWSEYLETTKEPNIGLAQLMSTTLVQLAELSPSYQQASANIEAAVEALEIVAEQRPTVNAFTTLAYYTYFTGDKAAAEKARAEAKKLADKSQAKAIDQQLDQVEKQANKYLKAKKEAEKQEKAAAAAGQTNPETGAPATNPFGGAFGEVGE
ncbi:MAG TPA: hypothetical protein VFU16_09535 [Solirubrobacterales bacterium]|nr:hypothetical protein [Solirubrobacterales bacterium]